MTESLKIKCDQNASQSSAVEEDNLQNAIKKQFDDITHLNKLMIAYKQKTELSLNDKLFAENWVNIS